MERNSKSWVIWFCVFLPCFSFYGLDWGFYAHRKINYYAALTVPPPLNQFFKSHIEYLRVHAVDPDKRRYAAPSEGPRHFIDLDRWYEGDSCILTRDYATDRIRMGHWEWRTEDSVASLQPKWNGDQRITFHQRDRVWSIDSFAVRQELFGHFPDTPVLISPFLYPDQKGSLYYLDSLTPHGIVPYYIESLYDRLVQEMQEKNLSSVVRLCADMGHYISDSHVPLHTTSNYNGQYTGQVGIHAFWESRIPELYESSHFNSLAGRAEYIPDIRDFIWETVHESYDLVDDVLRKEEAARNMVDESHHYCYEERGNSLVRTQCPELTKAYMELMEGMVQARWLASIHSVGSVWYSAWIDAGQPDLWGDMTQIDPDTGLLDRLLEKLDFIGGKTRSGVH